MFVLIFNFASVGITIWDIDRFRAQEFEMFDERLFNALIETNNGTLTPSNRDLGIFIKAC